MIDYILFPSDYFDVHQVDEGLRAEYDAAKDYFNILLFDNIKWFNEKKLVLSSSVEKHSKVVYRGWMMKSEDYADFYQVLLEENIQLITLPESYKLFHEFPNIYPKLEEDTAKMLTYPSGTKPNFEVIKHSFQRFLVKDYVKSVKDSRFPRYFESTMSNDELDFYLKEFMHFRGNLFTGGFCFKEFLELKKYGHCTNEYRIFYANNTVLSISKNSGQPSMVPMPPEKLIEKYIDLPSPYYTIDVAELEDGSWKIIEAGDGQVSGLSDSQNYETYFSQLKELLAL